MLVDRFATLKSVSSALKKLARKSRRGDAASNTPRTASGEGGIDPITLAVRAASVDADRAADSDVLQNAKDQFKIARDKGADSIEFRALLDLVSKFPRDARPQVLVARILANSVSGHEQVAIWSSILERFPGNSDARRFHLRSLVRDRGVVEARVSFEKAIAGLPDDFESDLFKVILLREFRDHDEIANAFDALIHQYEKEELAYVRYAEWLRDGSFLNRAASILRDGMRLAASTRRTKRMLEQMEPEIAAFVAIAGTSNDNVVVGEIALDRILSDPRLVARRDARQSSSFLGPVAMVTSSLGMGGAERQLTVTARTLHTAAVEGRRLGDYDVLGPVTVLCRSLHSRAGGDFFLRELVDAGVAVQEYREFSEYGGLARRSLSADWRELLALVPPQIREGTSRLADHLRILGPQVLHIWQDGSVLSAGLAAVMANVPRIILGVRTLPPADRMERNKPEYPVLYRKLLGMPGVRLAANSRSAAARYADWLGLPNDGVSVVYNGVEPLASGSKADSETLLARFDEATAPFSLTLGSVMRMDENKRPELWIEVAAAYLARDPRARFIIIGDGPMRPNCLAKAQQLGIANRVLLTGRRHDVGFWLSKMNAFMLLSRHEGLPNVLIEAQLAGIPVVATPAGGSHEAVCPAGRDLISDSAENVNVADVVAKLGKLADDGERLNRGQSARNWAEAQFSIDLMIAATLDLYCS